MCVAFRIKDLSVMTHFQLYFIFPILYVMRQIILYILLRAFTYSLVITNVCFCKNVNLYDVVIDKKCYFSCYLLGNWN